MKIVRVDSSTLPKMGVRWFKVTFDPDDYSTPQKMLDFGDYISEREVLNSDDHNINYWRRTEPVGQEYYELILKTNSKMYLDELRSKYHLTEIEKPEGIIDRHSTKDMIEIVKSAMETDQLLLVVPMRHPHFGAFTAKVAGYDELSVEFKKVEGMQGFPYDKELISFVYLNLFRIECTGESLAQTRK